MSLDGRPAGPLTRPSATLSRGARVRRAVGPAEAAAGVIVNDFHVSAKRTKEICEKPVA